MCIFPDEYYRGISDKSWITPQGYVSAAAFQFKEYNAESRENDDGYIELSINWNDDEKSLTTLLNQKKQGSDVCQFKFGYCKMNRLQVDLMLKQYIRDKLFSYERKPINEDEANKIMANPYHGNLLLHKTVEKQVKKNIEHILAGSVEISDVHPQTKDE